MPLFQIHMLQSYPISALNSDKTGEGKTMPFGGYLRARISSQAFKRPMRDMLSTNLVQTRSLPTLVRESLKERHTQDNRVLDLITGIVSKMGRKESDEVEKEDMNVRERRKFDKHEDRLRTPQMFRFTYSEVDQFANILWQQFNSLGEVGFTSVKVEDLEKSLAHESPADISLALFGRMVTSEAFLNVSAAVHVAHAFSVHAIRPTSDWFTGMDDLEPDKGAAMMGFKSMSTNIYYRYMNLDPDQLRENLNGGGIHEAVKSLLRVATMAHPKGSAAYAAPASLPDLVLVESLSVKSPVSYANAFMEPIVAPGENGMMHQAAVALKDYAKKMESMYSLNSSQAFIATVPFEIGQDVGSLNALADWMLQ